MEYGLIVNSRIWSHLDWHDSKFTNINDWMLAHRRHFIHLIVNKEIVPACDLKESLAYEIKAGLPQERKE